MACRGRGRGGRPRRARQARVPEWIVAAFGGQPYKGGRKGSDRGIDGYLHFRDADNKPRHAIISVKGGGIKSGDIRDLKGTMEREGAPLGVFLTLKEPTREMEKEAASAGLYEGGGRKFAKAQILAAAETIEGKRPRVPFGIRKPEEGKPRGRRRPAGIASLTASNAEDDDFG
jgi:hypothetical protein